MNNEITPEVIEAFRASQKEMIRQRRNSLLKESDWSQMPDAPLSANQKAAWAAYRKNLRDLPSQVTDLDNVEWPVAP